MISPASRREFLRRTASLAAYGAAAPMAFNLAAINAASAASAPTNYRALVCIFLYGGNDAHNTVIPYDAASHARYVAERGNLSVARASLTPNLIVPTGGFAAGRQFALPPELAPLKTLFDAGKLSVGLKVGTLVQPTSLLDFKAKRNLPPKLFSHADQFNLWQTASADGAGTGWGGRMGDLFGDTYNVNSKLLGNISFARGGSFQTGARVNEYAMSTAGAAQINRLPELSGSDALMQRNLARASAHLMDRELAARVSRNDQGAAILTSALASVPANMGLPSTGLGSQLNAVARMIAARSGTGAGRQVFFVAMGGFDNHSDLGGAHPGLLAELANGMSAFQAAMDNLGVGNQVTTFTASDFGRALTSNGDGVDHGWAGHQFVMGGSVKPKSWFGGVPEVRIGAADDVGQGRMLPEVSVEQYGATLAKWMGVAAGDIPSVMPGIARFNTRDLGFMQA
jgi:uncharacterized protein (DUF1501 family)